jgi:lipoprotein-anchoring transpeptidase ErfK/SrfK
MSATLRRGVPVLAVAIATAGVVAPARAAGSSVPVSQPLVMLLHDHVARAQPNGSAREIESVAAERPLTHVRTVLPLLGHATSAGDSWLRVQLPGRPNGHTAWILRDQTVRTSTEWQIAIKLSTRRVTVYRDGRVKRRFRAVVGKRSTPTPQGRFFIEEALSVAPQEAGGPFALATSARSNVLQEFEGGPGQVAIHGTDNLAGALGTAASHGCVRISADAITWLARRIGAGVPLTIKR